jgi:hypothetical protein
LVRDYFSRTKSKIDIMNLTQRCQLIFQAGIRKLANQLDSLSIIVEIWWSWVDLSLTETDQTPERIHFGELPQPRRARKSSRAETVTLSTVPS